MNKLVDIYNNYETKALSDNLNTIKQTNQPNLVGVITDTPIADLNTMKSELVAGINANEQFVKNIIQKFLLDFNNPLVKNEPAIKNIMNDPKYTVPFTTLILNKAKSDLKAFFVRIQDIEAEIKRKSGSQ